MLLQDLGGVESIVTKATVWWRIYILYINNIRQRLDIMPEGSIIVVYLGDTYECKLDT